MRGKRKSREKKRAGKSEKKNLRGREFEESEKFRRSVCEFSRWLTSLKQLKERDRLFVPVCWAYSDPFSFLFFFSFAPNRGESLAALWSVAEIFCEQTIGR